MPTLLRPGDRCHVYEIIVSLGTSDAAELYLAREPFRDPCVLKIMAAPGADKQRLRFAQEGVVLAKIAHAQRRPGVRRRRVGRARLAGDRAVRGAHAGRPAPGGGASAARRPARVGAAGVRRPRRGAPPGDRAPEPHAGERRPGAGGPGEGDGLRHGQAGVVRGGHDSGPADWQPRLRGPRAARGQGGGRPAGGCLRARRPPLRGDHRRAPDGPRAVQRDDGRLLAPPRAGAGRSASARPGRPPTSRRSCTRCWRRPPRCGR